MKLVKYLARRMNKDFIVFGKPSIEKEEINEVIDCLQSGWLGTGPKVKQFEDEFKNYKGASFVAAVNSCTAGLFLAMKALDIGQGDEVITTAMTFVATVNSIVHTGATPVLADINPVTWNIDPNEIEKKITPKTKAIIPVHFAGRLCDMDAIMYLANKYNLFVIEDCAHAIETEHEGKKAGTFGDFGVFSFYATKNITTGEGGMVISNDKSKIDRIKKLALHGLSQDAWKRFSDDGYKHYYADEPGYKYNMMDIQAAIGIHQLRRIDKSHLRREEIWNKYMRELVSLPIGLPTKIEMKSRHAYHLFQVLIDTKIANITRDELVVKMKENGIGVGVHYLSILEHPYYHKYRSDKNKFKNANEFGKKTISIPLSQGLTEDEVNRIIKTLRKVLN